MKTTPAVLDPLDYSGQRYEATVPDTLDLAARAELALSGIGGTIDARLQDGLYWRFHDPQCPWSDSYSGLDRPAQEDTAGVFSTGAMIRALVRWREWDGRTVWDDRIRELVQGLRRIAVQRNDCAYYPYGVCEPFCYPRSGWPNTDEPASETEGGEGAVTCFQAGPLHGLSQWYAVSGDRAALDLATRLARFCLLPKFWGGLVDRS